MDDAAAGRGPTCNPKLDSWHDVTGETDNVAIREKKPFVLTSLF